MTFDGKKITKKFEIFKIVLKTGEVLVLSSTEHTELKN